jgi:hypothetical protein
MPISGRRGRVPEGWADRVEDLYREWPKACPSAGPPTPPSRPPHSADTSAGRSAPPPAPQHRELDQMEAAEILGMTLLAVGALAGRQRHQLAPVESRGP